MSTFVPAAPGLRHLFAPGRIGRLELRNRLVMAAMDLELHTNGYLGDEHIAFYGERARGGVGLIIVGAFSVDPLGQFGANMLRMDEDRFLEPARELAASLKADGAVIAAQLFHGGRDGVSDLGPPIAPSAVQSRLTRRTPREMTLEDIQVTVERFGQAARRIREAGFDAIEIIGSGGFLISQFISPLTNKRTDEYGGDLENRLRFAREVVAAVRAAAGSDLAIIFKHSPDDLMPGGHTLVEGLEVARRLNDLPIDALQIQAGWEESRVPTSHAVVPRGAYAYLAHALKEVTTLPVIAGFRINEPVMADEIIASGRADFVAMARPLLADPHLPNKAREGRLEDINLCIACNQACLDTIFTGRSASCLVNPVAGRERELTLVPTAQPKRVVVVGGGPGGLEAARVLALRGHDVTLYERESRLGGQYLLAAVCPPKGEFFGTLRYWERQLEQLGVRVVLGRAYDAALARRDAPDAVVVATGVTPLIPDLPGVDLPHVVTAFDVLAGRVDVGRRVAIVGARGTGCDTALYLSEQQATDPQAAVFLAGWGAVGPDRAVAMAYSRRPIALMRRGDRVADDIGRTVRWILLEELGHAGIEVLTGVEYEEITPEGVRVRVGDESRLVPADTVVLATGGISNNGLAAELEAVVPEVHLIGDAKKIRDAVDAIYEAAIVGRAI